MNISLNENNKLNQSLNQSFETSFYQTIDSIEPDEPLQPMSQLKRFLPKSSLNSCQVFPIMNTSDLNTVENSSDQSGFSISRVFEQDHHKVTRDLEIVKNIQKNIKRAEESKLKMDKIIEDYRKQIEEERDMLDEFRAKEN